MKRTRILVVDDDAEIRLVLRRCFELEDYEVLEAADAEQMQRALAEGPVSLMTLDLKLGKDDGLALARAVRADHAVPIIMVTGKDDPVDRVVGLEIGADDYITKPFHLREVLARVRAVLRRSAGEKPSSAPRDAATAISSYAFANYTLSPAKRELRCIDGRVIPLTTAEFNMLSMFVERPGRVLTRDAIMDALKGHDWSPLDRSIDTMVGRLRKKIEINADNPKLIKTVRGAGYVFAERVDRTER